MITTARLLMRDLAESIRCLKHNLLDGASFSMSFTGGFYQIVTQENISLRFQHNPYLAFYEVTAGYLRGASSALEPGMCVIDAGACDGEFALYAARCVGASGRVLALEPDPANFARLRRTFLLNGGLPPHVELLPIGLWQHSGRVRFVTGQHLSSRIADVSDCEAASGVSVEVQSLSDLVARYRLNRLDFVKMDIEGAELEAIESARLVLMTFRPRLAIASYHRRDGRQTDERLQEILRNYGFDVVSEFPSHLTTHAMPQSAT
jgi:FkbM family methyltransferase